jgi:alpha-ribazole phosphatase
MAKKLIMIRHGALDIKYKGIFIGKTDVGLSALGRKQAAAIAGPVSNMGAFHCIVSPLRRSLETAQIALGTQGQAFDVDADLREIDFGNWEGKTFAEISKADSAVVQRLSALDNNFAFPGGENIKAFILRVQALAQRIAADPAQTVVAITHGGIIRFLICHYLRLNFRNYLAFAAEPASISLMTLDDGKSILRWFNYLSHLDGCNSG